MDGSVWVILPTYDEAENVEAMLDAVLASLDGAGIEGRVLVVDDGSPDGTADLAEAVAARDPRVAVLRRPHKRGIGPAYRAGFHRALAEGAEQPSAADLIVHCRERIGYKAPEEIVFLDEMPLNPTGKIDRVGLKRMAEDHLHPHGLGE